MWERKLHKKGPCEALQIYALLSSQGSPSSPKEKQPVALLDFLESISKKVCNVSAELQRADGGVINDKEEGKKEADVVSDWRKLFAAPTNSCFSLSYMKPNKEDGKIIVEPSEEIIEEGVKKWSGALVGQFLDRKPPFFTIEQNVQRLWGKNGKVRIYTMENGLLLFKFENLKTRDWVSDVGTWSIGGKPMIVSKWKLGIQPLKIKFNTIPMWVKFLNVPLEYWTEKGISCITSAVGKPLYADSSTGEGSRMDFLKVSVEISVEDELPNSFIVRSKGEDIEIGVEYPWKPLKCMHCKVFGHSSTNCGANEKRSGKMKQQWVPKTNEGKKEDEPVGVNVDAGNKELGKEKEDLVAVKLMDTQNIDVEGTLVVASAMGVAVSPEVKLGNVFSSLSDLEDKDEVVNEEAVEDLNEVLCEGKKLATVVQVVSKRSNRSVKSSSDSSPEPRGFKGLVSIDEVDKKKKGASKAKSKQSTSLGVKVGANLSLND